MTVPKYYGPEPAIIGSYKIGLERMTDIKDEVREIHKAHWDETEIVYITRPLDVDYDRFVELEDAAMFVIFTVRDSAQENKLVGNLMYFLVTSIHIKGMLEATEDAFFLAKEARKGVLAIRFLEFAEKALIAIGVKVIGMSDKAPCGGKSLEKLMGHMGYRPVARYYMKEV